MSASFYASPTIGATTTVAVFFHEIPHEVGDFALLVQSGFSKRAAMGAQFVTALGALLGTLIGIAVQEFGGGAGAGGETSLTGGLFGTSLTWYVSPSELALSGLVFLLTPARYQGRYAASVYGRNLLVRWDRCCHPRVT